MTKRERLREVVLPLLRCIGCGGTDLRLDAAALSCGACGARYEVYNDIPLMTPDPKAARKFPADVVVENAYSEQWLELLRRAGDRLVLDLGSGNNPNRHAKLIKLDIFALPNVDIVGVAEKLPFRDGIFHTVFSGAVFEHVCDPFLSIAEVQRVLADAGDVYIETAFLQPVHAFPSHYFNMTRMGLEYVCRGFQKIQSGVQPHQGPAFALNWYLQVLARKLPDRAKRDFLKTTVGEILDEYNHDPFSRRWIEHLAARDLEELACGVYFYGRKSTAPVAQAEALPFTPPAPRPMPFKWRLLRAARWLRRRLPV